MEISDLFEWIDAIKTKHPEIEETFQIMAQVEPIINWYHEIRQYYDQAWCSIYFAKISMNATEVKVSL